MSDDAAVPVRHIIKRTLTLTTTETWIVTIGPAFEAADQPMEPGTSQDITDQPNDSISQDDLRE